MSKLQRRRPRLRLRRSPVVRLATWSMWGVSGDSGVYLLALSDLPLFRLWGRNWLAEQGGPVGTESEG